MTIDKAGVPFILIAAAPAVAAAVWGPAWLAAALVPLPVAIALFFRDPERAITAGADSVLAPADGTVMHAGPARAGEAPPGTWQQITIFLSVLDVHINRTPVAGVVKRVEYIPGKFLPAYRHDAHQNERSEIWIDHHGVPIVVRQVVGLLARRVVCRLTPGQVLEPGARIGLMKFGSRMDVFVPGDAEVLATAGATVKAGVTVIARLRLPDGAR